MDEKDDIDMDMSMDIDKKTSKKDKEDIRAIQRILLDIGIPYDPRVLKGDIRATDLVNAHDNRPWAKPGWKWPANPDYISGIVSFSLWEKGPTTFLNLGETHVIQTICKSTDVLAVDFLEALIYAQTRNLGRKVHLFIEHHMVFTSPEFKLPAVQTYATMDEACEEWKTRMFSNLFACRVRFIHELANKYNFKGLLEVHNTDSRFINFNGNVYIGAFWELGRSYVRSLSDMLDAKDFQGAKQLWNSLHGLHNPRFCQSYLYHFLHLDLGSISLLFQTKRHEFVFAMVFRELSYLLTGMDPSVIASVRTLALLRFKTLYSDQTMKEVIENLNFLNTLRDTQTVVAPERVYFMQQAVTVLFNCLEHCGTMCVDAFMFLKMCKLKDDEPNAMFISISGEAHANNYNYFCNELKWNIDVRTTLGSVYNGCLKIERNLDAGFADVAKKTHLL